MEFSVFFNKLEIDDIYSRNAKKLLARYKECCEDNNDYIIISGTPYHSALVIKKIIINDHGNSINIKAEQQLCGSGIGLLFYLKIQIRKNISTITLGQENEIIWERGVKGK